MAACSKYQGRSPILAEEHRDTVRRQVCRQQYARIKYYHGLSRDPPRAVCLQHLQTRDAAIFPGSAVQLS